MIFTTKSEEKFGDVTYFNYICTPKAALTTDNSVWSCGSPADNEQNDERLQKTLAAAGAAV